MYLKKEDSRCLIQHGVLFLIDLVVRDNQNRILVGERINRPAQGYWFVPGGRVYENESLKNAFERICMDELGQVFHYPETKPLGLYDHFYNDSVFGDDISTHCISAPYLIELTAIDALNLPSDQHRHYRWVKVEDLACDDSIHQYSKVFLDCLCDRLLSDDYLDPKNLVNVKC